MNRIAEDVMFFKDNLVKSDSTTLASIAARKNSRSDKLVNKGYVILYIIAAIVLGGICEAPVLAYPMMQFWVIAVFVYPLVVCFKQPFVFAISVGVSIVGSLFIGGGVIGQIFLMRHQNIMMLVTAVLAFVINRIAIKWMKDEGKYVVDYTSRVIPLESEDEITKKLYAMKEEYGFPDQYLIPGLNGFYERDNPHDENKRFDLMIRIDKNEKYQYPVAKIPEERQVDRNKLWKNLLDTPIVQKMTKEINGLDDRALLQLLSNEESSLYVNNDYREGYLKIVRGLLSSIPQFKFNIDMVSELCNPMKAGTYWDSDKHRWCPYYYSYPRFATSVRPIIESKAYRNIDSIYHTYKTDLKMFNNDLKGTLIGADGEREVLKTLMDFEKIVGSDKMRILPNIRMEPNGMSIESDFIVVCQQGIFALEVKNLGSTGSYNITIEKDGLWKKVMKNGRWKEMSNSISRQNERHLMGIEQVVNSKLGNTSENWISAKSLIVFANNVVGIRNYSSNVIVRDSEVMTEIRKNPICLNEQQINQIYEILMAENLPAKKYVMENWMAKLVAVHLELAQRTQEIYPYLQEYIEINVI